MSRQKISMGREVTRYITGLLVEHDRHIENYDERFGDASQAFYLAKAGECLSTAARYATETSNLKKQILKRRERLERLESLSLICRNFRYNSSPQNPSGRACA